jgi:hypothetical protein
MRASFFRDDSSGTLVPKAVLGMRGAKSVGLPDGRRRSATRRYGLRRIDGRYVPSTVQSVGIKAFHGSRR